MVADDELLARLRSGETESVERTRSIRDKSKFGEAICAFANDLPAGGRTGLLFVGVDDSGACADADISHQLLQTLMGFRTDGTILPPPVISVRSVTLAGCTLAVVEVQPSDMPPLKYDGRVCVRIGPRRGFATSEEERRLTEKRRRGALTFDQQPMPGASLHDLDLLRFNEEYLPSAIHPDVLDENDRPAAQQLRAVGFTGRDDTPTVAGLLVVGKAPRIWLQGAYVQFVRYPGDEIGESAQDQKEIGGPLAEMLGRLDEIIELNIVTPAGFSGKLQTTAPDYPRIAVQELARNAVIHRNYEMTSSPVVLTWYSDRIEITSPGGLYGSLTEATLGQAGLTDSRNPVLAASAKAMGFVQRFGSGIQRAQRALERNGNPLAEFRVQPNFFNVTLRRRP